MHERMEDGEHPINEAPEWLHEIMTPTHELTVMRELALRYLAGDRTVPVGDEHSLWSCSMGSTALTMPTRSEWPGVSCRTLDTAVGPEAQE
jgi:hypothetical protein